MIGRWLLLLFLVALLAAVPFIIATEYRAVDACMAETARKLPQLSEDARERLCRH